MTLTIKDLKQEIIDNDGIIISGGTLNLEHLLPKAYDLIVAYNLDENLKHSIEAQFDGYTNIYKSILWYSKTY